jgi:HEAT repeat protein
MARRKEFEGRMLAILDPDLRHSSPSRKQSMALIGSLALIAIIVGAAARAPRLIERSLPAAPSAADLDLAISQQSEPVKGYPDSREIIGGSRTHQSTETAAQAEASAVATAQSRQTTTNQTQSTITYNVQEAIRSGMNTGMKVGMSAGQSALIAMLGKQAAGKDTDERPALLAKILATDTSASLRRIAAWGLQDYADRQVAAEALANALRRDRDASVREMAAWSLADADHSPVAIEALVAALRGDADKDVRETAVWSLGNIGDRSSADALAAALSDQNPEIRKRAAWALGNTNLRQAPRQLIAMLSDKDPDVREITAWALFQIEDPSAISGLEAALSREPDKELQIAYIRALAAVGEKSVDALRGLLESKDQEIRTIAVMALAGGNATGPWPRPWPQPRPFPN